MPQTYEPIATATLSVAGTNIAFTSIPGTYTDLRLVVRTQFSQNISSGTFRFYYNGNNTGSLYSTTTLYVGGTTSYSTSRTTEATVRITENLINANYPIFSIIDIFSYADTGVNKTALLSTSYMTNNTSTNYGGMDRVVNLWRSTSAITRIDVNAGINMDAGTTATLYGITKA